ncbi:MAG: type II toxin-antitoxin system VapC family toxin [Terriglobales bacterium]
MRLLLDTAILIYAGESPERLGNRSTAALRNPDNILELSSISLAEIAIKAGLGKLAISDAVVRQAIEDLDIRVLPFTSEHALRLFGLPLHHSDPFDRQIIAQALCEKIPVVTPDRKFDLYEGIKVIW